MTTWLKIFRNYKPKLEAWGRSNLRFKSQVGEGWAFLKPTLVFCSTSVGGSWSATPPNNNPISWNNKVQAKGLGMEIHKHTWSYKNTFKSRPYIIDFIFLKALSLGLEGYSTSNSKAKGGIFNSTVVFCKIGVGGSWNPLATTQNLKEVWSKPKAWAWKFNTWSYTTTFKSRPYKIEVFQK